MFLWRVGGFPPKPDGACRKPGPNGPKIPVNRKHASECVRAKNRLEQYVHPARIPEGITYIDLAIDALPKLARVPARPATIDQEKLSKWRAKRERILNNRPAIWLDVVAVLDDNVTECLSWTTRSVVTETRLFEIVNAYGWPVMFETRERFKALLYRPSLPNGSSMLTLMHLILSMSFLVDNTNTRSICPALGSQAGRIAGRGLLYLTHIGYLPPPPNPPSPLRPEEHPRPTSSVPTPTTSSVVEDEDDPSFGDMPKTKPNPVPPADPFDPWAHPVEAFIRMARDEPDALCINTYESGESVRYSYRDVWKHAYSIAQALKALPGWNDDGHDAVGTFCEGEAHWVFFSLAVWMLGKKTLNFGLKLPSPARKTLCTRHCIKYILHQCTKPGRTEGVKLLDSSCFSILDVIPPPSLELCEPLDEFIVYLCTSGTTGIPKTFKFSHFGATTVRASIKDNYSSVGVTQPPSFTAIMGCSLSALNLRGSLWFGKPSYDNVEKVEGIIKMMNEGLQFMFMPPSFMKLILDVATSLNPNIQWDGVKRILLGSEIIPPSIIIDTRDRCPNAELQFVYGSSEAGLVGAAAYFQLAVNEPITFSKLRYKQTNPSVRCLLIDDRGNILDQHQTKEGILVYAVDPKHPAKDHPNFTTSDPTEKLATFGFLVDGSPRVCTMDWVEMVGENEFSVVGRFDQKIKVNGVYVDLNYLRELVHKHLSQVIADCYFIHTSERKIILLYVLQKGSNPDLISADIIRVVEDMLLLLNVSKFPIHNCLRLHELPFNDSGKVDLKKLKRIAENIEQYGQAVDYPPLMVTRTFLTKIAFKISEFSSQILDSPGLYGRNFYIGGVGFDSLSIGRLAIAIKEEYGVEISPMILLSNSMSPKNVAQLVVDILDDKLVIPPTIDLAAEAAKLDDASVTAEGFPPFVYPKEVRGIVLTGATSFLGAFLIFELAHKFPRAKIYCLARTETEKLAFLRTYSNASRLVIASRNKNDPWYDVRDRWVGLRGDVSKERWALSDERWKEICEETDMIVHNAAEVHWLYNYNTLKATNVLSTVTVLQLATTHHLKVVHYISTIGTIAMAKGSDKPLEEKMYSNWNLSGGYSQTKWVSEQLINKARSRGVPATIIRPAMIAGDSGYGVCNTDDYIWRYIEGCIKLGVCPANASPVTWTMDPVDHVAKAIAEIVSSEEALSKFVFHISDSEHSVITEKRVFEIADSVGWTVLQDTREKFRTIIWRNPSPDNHALLAFMRMLMDLSFRVDNTNTRSIYPTPCPSPELVVRKSLFHLDRVSYLDQPTAAETELKDEEYPDVRPFTRTGRH
ncbi:male sterility protein-domain-containing protein [Polychytrium aggregatum]|uniref:male sterility protein-domain-containing protein n=1 Tax=Polychytrium aggregatum TaxID=110093 RepID=UPI0022FE858F|nr:male sterility protein-domain-containing protein [Polychytrium aggregatum]KAI9202465.1 male sterility protein-domain-containing protein [Polychytrium aggregatum]